MPAILSRESSEITEKLKFLESIPEISDVHIDFADGKFVESTTVLPRVLRPFQTKLKVEAHLMTHAPQHYFYALEMLGVALVNIHFESFHRVSDLMAAVKNASFLKLESAVVFNPETEIAEVEHVVRQVNRLALMSVYPGFQGRKFLRESFSRLETLRKLNPHAIIEIDGGINLENISQVAAAGATRIVVGSGIWQTHDVKQRVHDLLAKINTKK